MEDFQSIAYGFVDEIFVVIHRSDTIDERDWRRLIGEARGSRRPSLMLLVLDSGMPDVSQRYDLIELHEEHAMKVAMLSDSEVVHRVVTALKWAGVDAKGFPMDDLDGVLAFFERRQLWARLSSALGPYLERSWLRDPSLLSSTRAQPQASGSR